MSDSRAVIPVTPAQRRLFLHHRLHPGDASFNVAPLMRIRGDVRVDRLRGTLERILGASVAFNTVFAQSPDGDWAVRRPGEALVAVEAAPEPDRALLAAGAGAEYAEAAAAGTWLGAWADTPLPPDRWPLYRFTILTGEHAAYLAIVCSHLVCDAFSMANLASLISQLYADPGAWDGLAGRLADDPGRLVSATPASRAVPVFQAALRGRSRLDHPGLAHVRTPDGVLTGRNEQHWLCDPVTKALNTSGLTARYGPYAVFLAAYAVLLAGYSGQPDVVLGVPLANRHGLRQRRSLGYFVNTLPLRIDIDQAGSFAQLCETLATRIFTLLRYQDFDLAAYAEQVFGGRPAGPLAVDNSATFYAHRFPLVFEGCQVDPLPVPRRQLRYPLGMHVQADGHRYLVGTESLDRFADGGPGMCLETVLRAGLADPDRLAARIPLLDRVPAARSASPRDPAPTTALPASLPAWFASVAREHSSRLAVTDSCGSWSYAELHAAAGRVARELIRRDLGPAVAVAMRPRRELVAVLLGILLSGRAYVPIDPHAPDARVAHIVAQFDALPLIADDGLLMGPGAEPRLDPADLLAAPAAQEPGAEEPGASAAPARDALAYIIFTSGSTGSPKGVRVTHRNVMRLFTVTEPHYRFGPSDTWCLFHSYAFDFSVWELFGALLYGGRLVIPREQVLRSPLDFARLLAREGVTVLNQTPSAFRRLTGVLTPELAARLAVRWVVFGGEALYPGILRPWVELAGTKCRLANMYGITETTVHTTFCEIDPSGVGEDNASVIGEPLADLTVVVADRNLNPCPIGVPGELLVSGPGVAAGYHGQPQLTARAFLTGTRYGHVVYRSGDRGYLRGDGRLVYVGRVDRQVQLRGYRIEPGEVESALLAVPGVRAAHVRLHQPASGEPFLAAWIAADPVPDAEIRSALRQRLPGYMVPSVLMRVRDIPLTVNGKVDDAALPPPAEGRTSQAASAAPADLTSAIARIWAESIHCGDIGPDDNFFDMGGTSMHVAEIHRRLIAELAVTDVPMIDLFDYATPRQLAARIAGDTRTAPPLRVRPVTARRSAERRHPAPRDLPPRPAGQLGER